MGTYQDNFKNQMLYEIGKGEQDLWKASISYLNNLGWKLSWSEESGKWHLHSWNRSIFTSHEWLVIQSFVYGMVYSTLNILFRMNYPPKQFSYAQTNNKDPTQDNRPIVEVFAELVTVNERIFQYETRFATPGRAVFMYRAYRKKQYDLKNLQEFEDFATFYKRKLTLEAILKSLSEKGVDYLKSAASKLEPIQLGRNERLPVALAFLFLYLEKKSSSWYQIKKKWYYFEGDQLIFSARDRDDFEAFVLGMSYNYARLSDKVLNQYITGPLTDR